MHIFTSWKSGDIPILLGFAMRSSAVEPPFEGSCYRVAKSFFGYRDMEQIMVKV